MINLKLKLKWLSGFYQFKERVDPRWFLDSYGVTMEWRRGMKEEIFSLLDKHAAGGQTADEPHDNFNIHNFDHITVLMDECNHFVTLCNAVYRELGEEEGELTGQEDLAIKMQASSLMQKYNIYVIATDLQRAVNSRLQVAPDQLDSQMQTWIILGNFCKQIS